MPASDRQTSAACTLPPTGPDAFKVMEALLLLEMEVLEQVLEEEADAT